MVAEKQGSITNDYTLLKPPIGKGFNWWISLGAFGEVRKGIHKVTNQIRAIKVISKEKASKAEVERLRIEIEILKRLVILNKYNRIIQT